MRRVVSLSILVLLSATVYISNDTYVRNNAHEVTRSRMTPAEIRADKAQRAKVHALLVEEEIAEQHRDYAAAEKYLLLAKRTDSWFPEYPLWLANVHHKMGKYHEELDNLREYLNPIDHNQNPENKYVPGKFMPATASSRRLGRDADTRRNAAGAVRGLVRPTRLS